MSFESDLSRFIGKMRDRQKRIHNRVAELAFRSIVVGSPITGAPGQPVRTGNLKNSWQKVLIKPFDTAIITHVPYAPNMEDHTGNFHSEVGGAHSVKMTRAGFDRLVKQAVLDVVK